ncbi:MAG: hypothetical protein AAGN46_12160 [Acidobacteriota bacterium]
MIGANGATSCPGIALPSSEGAFSYFFRPALERAPSLFWFARNYINPPFMNLWLQSDEGEQEFDAHQIEVAVAEEQQESDASGDGLLFRPPVLPAWANHVPDDWCEIHGLSGPETEALEIARAFRRVQAHSGFKNPHADVWPTYELVENHAVLAFYCIDGFSWEIYSQDPHLLALTRRHVESCGPSVIEDALLATREEDRFGKHATPRPSTNDSGS